MFYSITYTARHNDGNRQNVVLSDLSADALADVFRFLADMNAHGEWFVWEATVYTMAGDYFGNPSWLSFAPLSERFTREAVAH